MRKPPDGWAYCTDKDGRINQYAIKRGNFTVCRIGSAEGWSYELWHKKQQVEVNFKTSEDAITAASVREAMEPGEAA